MEQGIEKGTNMTEIVENPCSETVRNPEIRNPNMESKLRANNVFFSSSQKLTSLTHIRNLITFRNRTLSRMIVTLTVSSQSSRDPYSTGNRCCRTESRKVTG